MKLLFVVPNTFFSEPLGVMQLSAICKRAGHATRLAILAKHDFVAVLDEYQPDFIGYSTMSCDIGRFMRADDAVKAWSERTGKKVFRMMGGPHPTYFKDVVSEMALDAVCIGDGDKAILRVVEAIEDGSPIAGIPNVATPEEMTPPKEIVEDLDALPFMDRNLLYDADPSLQEAGIRSFLSMKGCPYKCTYCFNHAYNKMFKGDGRKIIRRRSVDNLLAEIKYVVRNFPEVRFLKFTDDVFVVRGQVDDWLREFARRYREEIGIPFYCLIRSNALTEEVAQVLAEAGCRSVAMSIESGVERLRNEIMKRNMPDQMLIDAFNVARKYGINTLASTILAVPNSTLEDDYASFLFSRRLRATAPTFVVFCPYPGTELTDYAHALGMLSSNFNVTQSVFAGESLLTCFSEREKKWQIRLCYLGPIFCALPDFTLPVMRVLLKLPLTPVYELISRLVTTYQFSMKIFPGAHPRRLSSIAKSVVRSVAFLTGRDRKDRWAGSVSPTPAETD